jgi:hypothetical protein
MKSHAPGVVVVLMGIVASVWATSTITGLNADAKEAEKVATEAQDDAVQTEEELTEAKSDLRKAKRQLATLRDQQKQQPLSERLQEGTAELASGLSADVTDFTCLNYRCTAIRGRVDFVNDTQEGSAVTCVFRAEYKNGKQTSFTWYSEYVPPKGRDNLPLYINSGGYSEILYWYDSETCYRGIGLSGGDL